MPVQQPPALAGPAVVRRWLSPADRDGLCGPGAVTAWQSGRDWEALQMPEPLGLAVFAELATEGAELGPVMHEVDHHVLWLILPGSPTTSWPEPTRLLPSGRWIAVPATAADGRPFQAVRWLHLPEQPGRLTEPALLSAVLARHTPAAKPGRPRPGSGSPPVSPSSPRAATRP